MRSRAALFGVALCALLAAALAVVSTGDFIEHLDGQFHPIHCSLVPGLGTQALHTGCHAALFSAYSSVLRGYLWGGLPISLLGLGVFVFLLLPADYAACPPT
jgi:hypothetical protein